MTNAEQEDKNYWIITEKKNQLLNRSTENTTKMTTEWSKISTRWTYYMAKQNDKHYWKYKKKSLLNTLLKWLLNYKNYDQTHNQNYYWKVQND